MDDQKLTDVEFLNQIEALVKRAPDNLVYMINVLEDPKKEVSRQIITACGTPKDLCFAFKSAFDKSPELKDAIEKALRIHSIMNSKGGLSSIIREMTSRPDLEETMHELLKEFCKKEGFGPGH